MKDKLKKGLDKIYDLLNVACGNCIIEESERDNLQEIICYIEKRYEQLEKENKKLKKGINSLMQSSKKWKDRYYKLKTENSNISRELLHRTDELNKLLEENETLIKNTIKADKFVDRYIWRNYIPKQVIRNKIEELEKELKEYDLEEYCLYEDTIQERIKIYKELLGDE